MKQLICNIITFSAYAGNVIFLIFALWNLRRTLKSLSKECEGLTEEETAKLCRKRYWRRVQMTLAVNALFFIAIIVSSLADGRTLPMEYRHVPRTAIILLFFALTALYTAVLGIKSPVYIPISTQKPLSPNAATAIKIALHSSLALVFSLSTGTAIYTLMTLII